MLFSVHLLVPSIEFVKGMVSMIDVKKVLGLLGIVWVHG